LNCHLYQDVENENALNLVVEWKAKRVLEKYIRSESFSILLGALNLLSESSEILLAKGTQPAGIRLIANTKGKQNPADRVLRQLQAANI
jgi:hypothetical protein